MGSTSDERTSALAMTISTTLPATSSGEVQHPLTGAKANHATTCTQEATPLGFQAVRKVTLAFEWDIVRSFQTNTCLPTEKQWSRSSTRTSSLGLCMRKSSRGTTWWAEKERGATSTWVTSKLRMSPSLKTWATLSSPQRKCSSKADSFKVEKKSWGKPILNFRTQRTWAPNLRFTRTWSATVLKQATQWWKIAELATITLSKTPQSPLESSNRSQITLPRHHSNSSSHTTGLKPTKGKGRYTRDTTLTLEGSREGPTSRIALGEHKTLLNPCNSRT